MMDWLREFAPINEDRLRGAIWLHENLDKKKAKRFWSELTGIPTAHFHKTYIAKNKPQSKKIRKQLHKCGVFSIRYSDMAIHRRLQGWISGLIGDKISFVP